MTIPSTWRGGALASALAVAILALAVSPARAEDGGIAQIDQVGSGNRTDIEQKFVASGGLNDMQNRAEVSQGGTNNEADIIQHGDSLTATVTQTNDDNRASVEQYGSGHKAEVLQNGGDRVTVEQTNIYTNIDGNPTGTGGPGQTVIVDQTH